MVMLFWLLIDYLVLLLLLTNIETTNAVVELHIGGLFPMEAGTGGWAGGEACLPAVKMAIEDVNKDDKVLAGYTLKLHQNNSKCQAGLAARQMYELLYTPPTKLMLLTGCSPVTTVVAEAAPMWNLIVLSYGGSSPALSNRKRFKTLFRTHPTANMQNPTRVELFRVFKWEKISIIQSVEEVFTSTAKDLEKLCRENGIQAERQSFYGNPVGAIKALKRQDARIIVGLFYVNEARRVLCQAYHHGLYGKKYVWFFIGWYADKWFENTSNVNCTKAQMKLAAEYHITTESIMLSASEELTISGMTGKQFQRRLSAGLDDPANTGGYPEAPLAYDAIWAVALAFNCTISKLPREKRIESFNYNDTFLKEKLFACVQNTRFKGVSGQVMFNQAGDRIAKTQIEQLQDGEYKVLGIYDTPTKQLTWTGVAKFNTADGRPPPDSTIIRETKLTVGKDLYFIIVALALLQIITSIVAVIFNIKNLDKGVIKFSQPHCNNLLITGCFLCSLSLILLGLPIEEVNFSSNQFSFLCHSRILLLMFGFSLAYGSLFAKVWNVHQFIHKQRVHSKNKDEIIPPHHFYIVITVFLVIDLIIILFWVFLDPLRQTKRSFPLQEIIEEDGDVKVIPVLELCQSVHQKLWTGLIFGYKCLLLVLGLFLSYDSRNLRYRYVNDFRMVGLAIYNVAILSLITGVVVTFLIPSHANANFAFIGITVLLCTYVTIGLIFIPKIIYLHSASEETAEEPDKSGSQFFTQLTKAERKRMEQLAVENAELLKKLPQNDELAVCQNRQNSRIEEKTKECKELLRRRTKLKTATFVDDHKISDEVKFAEMSVESTCYQQRISGIELHPEAGTDYTDEDKLSSCSDEILL
uniref:G_PROTEIN_RECEP_F3_4 domain-containing protein n=1 Tax=Syphacia muris TaxID=451379 RepID=A0A0N5AF94_9BILA